MPNAIDVKATDPRCPRITTQRNENSQLSQLVRVVVGRCFDVPLSEMAALDRGSARVCTARQIAMYLTHVVFRLSLTAVGREFHRDRSTVSHACQRVELRRDDRRFDMLLSRIEWQLRAATGRED